MLAIALPVLIGGTGYAIDTAQWFLWKREIQHSVDQAAIGAAWELSKNPGSTHYKLRAKQEFDANEAITKSFTSTPSVSLASFGNGTDNSVVVTARVSKSLPFSSIIMHRPVVINVRAQASYSEGGDYNACLISLATDNTGISIGGNANVRARCGLAALSCDDDAVVIDGSATVKTDSIATCGTADVPEENQSAVREHITGLRDAYADLAVPTSQGEGKNDCSGKGKNKSATLSPGVYKGGLVAKCTTVLTPGIYVIDGGELDLTANYDVTGTNVMFVLKNGARMKFGGNGNGNKVTLTPMVAADFTGTPLASKADRYQGILVFEDPQNNPGNPGHVLNGNSNSLIEGQIYLPSGDIKVLGTASVAAQCLQISAHRIHVSGNADLQTLCPVKDTTSVGTSTGTVRLVG